MSLDTWLARRTAQLLPVPYFLVTFTVPSALRKFVRAHQRDCYRALFDCGSQTIRDLASGPRFVGTDRMGFFGALHTWGRDFTVYHPHAHFVVPGGGVSDDGSQWQACPENFLLPEKAASTVYRAKFRDAMRDAGLLDDINAVAPDVWRQKWVVDVEAVGDGRATLKYLAPYVYRVAISNNRIVAVDESSVTYRFTPTRKDRHESNSPSAVVEDASPSVAEEPSPLVPRDPPASERVGCDGGSVGVARSVVLCGNESNSPTGRVGLSGPERDLGESDVSWDELRVVAAVGEEPSPLVPRDPPASERVGCGSGRVGCDGGTWRHVGGGVVERTVTGDEFLRGFLQHTLPSNFHRVRYYGFASQNSRLTFAWVRLLVWAYLGWTLWLAKQPVEEDCESPPLQCPKCGGVMLVVAITDGDGNLLYKHPLPYLDSG